MRQTPCFKERRTPPEPNSWMRPGWVAKLSQAFEVEISGFDGTVAEYLLTQNSHINVVGKVFSHLVENKSDEHPFAFLATYSWKSPSARKSCAGKAEHVPLKNALLEYKDDQTRLLQLLSTVSQAADASPFISELVENGELFSPLRFAADEAYIFT